MVTVALVPRRNGYCFCLIMLLTSNVKELQFELDKKTVSHYAKLDINEIKELVVVAKWFDQLSSDLEAEIELVTEVLTNRIKELEERYAHSMPELVRKVSKYCKSVEDHLKKMGLNW